MPTPLPLDAHLRPLLDRAQIPHWQALSQRSGLGIKRLRQLRRGQWQNLQLRELEQLGQCLGMAAGELWAVLQGQEVTNPQQQWQREAFQQLESFLTYWPAAAYQVEQGKDLPAAKLLPLVRPIEQLLAQWQITAIGPVGAEAVFDPHQHQSLVGAIEPGATVRIRYPGYRHGDNLLGRAKVEPLG